MKISILTLFPQMFSGPFDHSIVKRAVDKKLVKINLVNIRDFGLGKHKMVDDKPFGGGSGMILKVDVLCSAINSVKNKKFSKEDQKVFLLSAHGKTFNWKTASDFSKLKHLILVCGHYEGVDERIKNFIDGEISIGDFIITGGEIPSMLITDAVVRLLKGVLKDGVGTSESFFENLEHPHYTTPREFNGLTVPDVLVSGNHHKIQNWKKEKSLEITKKLRPDLLKKA
ncbi:tRNA (guanosine(37)-N1)-methyltransferase TrmD [Patescibacteria group bacterium]|nr:tRNA (guanosine(37)-N1)-methyltransferase TrmD [Patescibacteria group bacterium]